MGSLSSGDDIYEYPLPKFASYLARVRLGAV